MKQDKNYFQVDLMIDRIKRDNQSHFQQKLLPSSQKQNVNALMQGVGLRYLSRGDPSRPWKRKGSVPIPALYKHGVATNSLINDLTNLTLHGAG